jgi:hypothetical protein
VFMLRWLRCAPHYRSPYQKKNVTTIRVAVMLLWFYKLLYWHLANVTKIVARREALENEVKQVTA